MPHTAEPETRPTRTLDECVSVALSGIDRYPEAYFARCSPADRLAATGDVDGVLGWAEVYAKSGDPLHGVAFLGLALGLPFPRRGEGAAATTTGKLNAIVDHFAEVYTEVIGTKVGSRFIEAVEQAPGRALPLLDFVRGDLDNPLALPRTAPAVTPEPIGAATPGRPAAAAPARPVAHR